MDGSNMVNANMVGQPPQHSHEMGKGNVVDNGYESGGSNGYLAPPPMCQGPPQPHPPSQYPNQVIHPGDPPPSHYNQVVYPVHAAPAPPIPYQVPYDARVPVSSWYLAQTVISYFVWCLIFGKQWRSCGVE